jgi:hypothetical protein
MLVSRYRAIEVPVHGKGTTVQRRSTIRALWIGALIGVGLYAMSLLVVLYQRPEACAVNAAADGDPEFSDTVRLLPASIECTWPSLPGTPTTTATDPVVAVLSVIGASALVACALVLLLARRRHLDA